jgi:hypothetical protein
LLGVAVPGNSGIHDLTVPGTNRLIPTSDPAAATPYANVDPASLAQSWCGDIIAGLTAAQIFDDAVIAQLLARVLTLRGVATPPPVDPPDLPPPPDPDPPPVIPDPDPPAEPPAPEPDEPPDPQPNPEDVPVTILHKQFIRMSKTDAENYVGPEGEIIVELDTFMLRVQDGLTPGGYLTLTQQTADALYASLTDFNAQIAALSTQLDDDAADAYAAILAAVLIHKGPVLDIVTALPSSPAAGDRYLLAHAGLTGSAVGHNDQVAEYTVTGWLFSGAPLEGHEVYVNDVNTKYYFDGTNWGTNFIDASLNSLQTQIDANVTALGLKAPIASPTFTGVPAAPTAAPGTDTTQIATTEFVQAALGTSIAADLGTSGSIVLGDAILKWGHYGGGSSNPTINFPAAFPNACHNVQLTAKSTAADTADAANTYTIRKADIDSFDETGFSAFCSAEAGVEDVFHAHTGVEFYWFAIGS